LLNYPPPGYEVNPDLPAAVNGGVLVANGTPSTDLAFALDNIFNHPNVGPFISKQLIQRLVTSNPSPEYVRRISNVFNNNGSNQRGDLKAVVRAILLDPEARYGSWAEVFGVAQPLLRLTHSGAQCAIHKCGNDHLTAPDLPQREPAVSLHGYVTAWVRPTPSMAAASASAAGCRHGVQLFAELSAAREMTTRGLLGPEFQINTDTLTSNRRRAPRTRPGIRHCGRVRRG
jgi:hypothetical protein